MESNLESQSVSPVFTSDVYEKRFLLEQAIAKTFFTHIWGQTRYHFALLFLFSLK